MRPGRPAREARREGCHAVCHDSYRWTGAWLEGRDAGDLDLHSRPGGTGKVSSGDEGDGARRRLPIPPRMWPWKESRRRARWWPWASRQRSPLLSRTGNRPSAASSVSWSTPTEALGLATIPPLEPGAGTTVSLSQPFAVAGLLDVTCKLSAPDDLPPDDSARFLLNVTQSVPILVVEGEPQANPDDSDTRYFMAALGYGNGGEAVPAASIFRPKLVNYEKLRGEELSAYQCVVLADVPRLPSDLAQKLARYVSSGGGLWITLGEQTDVTAFNEAFFEQSAGLSGLALRAYRRRG